MPTAAPAYFVAVKTIYPKEKTPSVSAFGTTEGSEPMRTELPLLTGDEPGEMELETHDITVTPRARTLKVEWGGYGNDTSVVRPGEPIEKQFGDATVRLEARRVDPKDTRRRPGEKRISPTALRAMTQKLEQTSWRRDALDNMRLIRAETEAARTVIDDWADDVGGNEKLVAAALADMRKAVEAPLKEANKIFAAIMKSKAKPKDTALDRLSRIADDVRDEARAINDQLEEVNSDAFAIEGRVRITAKMNDAGKLDHWLIRFENEGDQPFIGTAAFAKSGKNAGLGLESMAVPYDGSVAVQRIPAGGNYSNYNGRVRAKPGAELRVAVRGLGWATMELPSSGTASLRVEKFVNDIFSDSSNHEYFEEHEVESKREEKVEEFGEDGHKVKFYDNGRRWMPDDWEYRRDGHYRRY